MKRVVEKKRGKLKKMVEDMKREITVEIQSSRRKCKN